MKRALLAHLACPACAGEIGLRSSAAHAGAEIEQGDLECAACGRSFPIVRGVPRFAALDHLGEAKAATAESFGWQWTHFRQEDQRYAEQFLGWIAPVTPDDFKGEVVLDCGCGKGRHTRLAAAWGAREVIGVDLSAAVDVAHAATRDLGNVHIIQADVYHLPLRRTFDRAVAVGVLHHLPDPAAGFRSVAAKVKPGGRLSAWVYGAENNEWIVRLVNPVRKNLTSRMNRRALLELSKLPAAALYVATRFVYGPLNRNPRTERLARRLFYNDYLRDISRFGWREQHTIVFDHLVAPTAFYVSRAEFESWWRAVGAHEVVIGWHNRNSWRGLGRIG